ncbi:hypothetical protein ACS0TY_002542 [Phlomoides rotata]
MAAVADVCMGELTKLRAKVIARNPFFLKLRKADATKEVEDDDSCSSSSSSSSPAMTRSKEVMPETTVLLLLDRFAPC